MYIESGESEISEIKSSGLPGYISFNFIANLCVASIGIGSDRDHHRLIVSRSNCAATGSAARPRSPYSGAAAARSPAPSPCLPQRKYFYAFM